MHYIIFTNEGLEQAMPTLIAEKARLWANPELLNDEQQAQLTAAGVLINILPQYINANNEKAVLSALSHVEQAAGKSEIFIEYV